MIRQVHAATQWKIVGDIGSVDVKLCFPNEPPIYTIITFRVTVIYNSNVVAKLGATRDWSLCSYASPMFRGNLEVSVTVFL
jgi:hypothetical protein